MFEHHEQVALLPGRNGTQIGAKVICVPAEQRRVMTTLGFGHNPFDALFTIYLFQIIIYSVISNTFYFLLRPLKQPKFVCRMLAAVILGPSVLGRFLPVTDKIFPEKERLLINTAANIGFIYYIFLYAVKTDVSVLLKTARNAWSIGPLSLIVPYVLISCVQSLLYLSLPDAGIDVGTSPKPAIANFVLSVSYLSDMINMLERLNLLNSELANIAMTCAMFNDALGWTYGLMIIILSNPKVLQRLAAFLSFWVFLGVMFWVVRPAISRIIKTTHDGKVKEVYMIFLLLAPLINGFIGDLVGINFLIATLLLGIFIPDGMPLGAALIEKSEMLVDELFAPFVFIKISLIFDVDGLFSQKAAGYSLLFIGAYLTKFLAAAMASCYFKLGVKDVLMLGLMLNLRGIMPFFFVNKEASIKNLDSIFFSTFVMSHLFMTAIAVALLEKFYKTHGRLGFSRSSRVSARSLQTSCLSIGEFRVLLCIHNEEDAHGIINLLEALNPTEISPLYAYVINAVDLIGRGTPLLTPYKSKNKIKSTSGDRIVNAFTNFSKRFRRRFAMQPFTLIAPYKTMHESMCRMARDKHVPLIIVPFHKMGGENITTNIRNFNASLQAYAPCTVGILVQGMSFTQGYGCAQAGFSRSYFNIGVIFLGGDDDLEALALVDRMSTHHHASITVIRITLTQMEESISEEEMQRENKVFEELKDRHANNACITFTESKAEDIVQVIHTVQSLGHSFDLMVVGRQQMSDAEIEDYIANWTDHAELGLLGDMIASPEFCGGTVSVLVMQHHKASRESIHSR